VKTDGNTECQYLAFCNDKTLLSLISKPVVLLLKEVAKKKLLNPMLIYTISRSGIT